MKYSSLFTHPSHLPINRAFGEVKSRLNSSPLFTTLHLCLSDNHKGCIRQIQLPGLLVLLEFDKHISCPFLTRENVPLWVKRGEELRELFTSPNALFIGVCEGWVKSEEYLAKISAATYRHSLLLSSFISAFFTFLNKSEAKTRSLSFSLVALITWFLLPCHSLWPW